MAAVYPKKVLATITPETVKSFLVARGWRRNKRASHSDADFYIRILNGSAEAEALVSLRPDYQDYARRVADVIRDVADAERQSLVEVYLDLLSKAGQKTPTKPVTRRKQRTTA